MRHELSAPASPSTTAGATSPVGAVARLLGLPESGLGFSVPPRHRGGIEARSGLGFQDQDALGQVGRLLRHDGRRALSVRLEGAGDTDVLAPREGGGLVEEYRQVKGRKEGLARWTLAELGKERVWSEFIRTAIGFAERAEADRFLLLVFVTDGELDRDLHALRDAPAVFRNGSGDSFPGRAVIRGRLLMHCALGLLSPRDGARILSSAGRDGIRRVCEEAARILDRAWPQQEPTRRVTADWPTEVADVFAGLAPRLDGEDEALLSGTLEEAARHLDFLLESLRLESRVGRSGVGAPDDEAVPPEQAEVVLLLIEAGRLDASSAREAVRKLRTAVADRSLQGATLDEGALRRIVDLPPPLQLDPFPTPVAAPVSRVETGLAILHALHTHRAAWVYGAPRVGKTEALRAALEMGQLRERTVWLRLSGDGSDCDRIWLHLAFWIGERTGNRELYRALGKGGVQAIEVRAQIARAGGELQAVLVADGLNALPEAGHGAVLATLEEARLGGVRVAAVAEDRPGGTGTGFAASAELVAIEGFTFAEALEFWRALGAFPADDAATLAAMRIVHRTAGHPEILRMIVRELPERLSAADLDAVRDALPAGQGANLLRELARKLFRANSGDDFQRGLIPRVAVVAHEITEAQAKAIAALNPRLRWSAFGWLDLSTTLLEEVRRGRYRLPPIYQAVARMEVEGDDVLTRAVHQACADTVLERFSRERTIEWPDLYEATLDYVFALDWKNAAINALWLANSAPLIPAAQERLQLALVVFRGPAAMTCGLEPDLHVAVLGALVMAERAQHDPEGVRDALAAMRRVAEGASGDAGYRARGAAALFTGVDAFLAGDHAAAVTAVDPAWREAAERGDALQLGLLGNIRISAAVFGAGGVGVILEQIEAIERAGEAVTCLADLGLNESTRGLLPFLYSRATRSVDGTCPELIEAYAGYLAAFRARGILEGVAAVAPSLCALLYDGGRKHDALALAGQVARELAGTPKEGEGILLLADFHRLEEEWGAAVEAYGCTIPLLHAAGSPWLRAAHTGAALALHHQGDQRLAACHAFAAYRLLAADEDASPRGLYEALGRAAVLSYRAARYRPAAACLSRLLRHAADAGDAKRKRLVLMLARQIAESIGAAEPRFGAAPGSFPTPDAELPPPAAATALGVYFFEQELDAVGLLGEPENVSNLAHHCVFNTLAAVGLTRQAVRAGKKAVAEWLRSGDWAGAMTSFDLLRHVEDRAGDVEGALSRVWEVLPPATALAEDEGKERSYAEQVVLDYWTPAPLSRLAGLARDEAERLLDAFVARFDVLTPQSRKEWASEAEVARARIALAKGDRRSADHALVAASESANGTRIAERVRIHAARLRAFGNGAGYSRDMLEALRLQAQYAEHLAAAGGIAEKERGELGHRLQSFWTETVNSSEPPFDFLAELFSRDRAAVGFRGAAANLLAALDLIEAPRSVGADLAARLLDGGGADLGDAQLAAVLRAYVAAGLDRAVAAGLMGNARFARQEFETMSAKLRTHWSAFEPAMRRLFPPEVIDQLLRFGEGAGQPAP